MLKRKYHMEDIADDDEDDCLIKRPKSESDDFKLDIEFGDSLPGDDISTWNFLFYERTLDETLQWIAQDLIWQLETPKWYYFPIINSLEWKILK